MALAKYHKAQIANNQKSLLFVIWQRISLKKTLKQLPWRRTQPIL